MTAMHGDQHRQPARLAEARGEQIGDRGDALVVADAHEAPQDEPPADEDDGGAEIDGEIFEPVARGRTDRAVEGPAGAVDRDGERVDEGRAQEARLAAARAPVADIGDEEEQADVADGDGDDEIGRQHQPSSPSRGSASGSRGSRAAQPEGSADERDPAGEQVDAVRPARRRTGAAVGTRWRAAAAAAGRRGASGTAPR